MRRCLDKYGTAEKFLVLFNPSLQFEYTRDLTRVYKGEAPNLGVLGKAFGANIPVAWLIAQLRDLSEFAGVRDKLDGERARRLAEVIVYTWPHFTVTELMLFFMRFKSGRYGRFYGSVDPIVITDALHKYAAERIDERARIDHDLQPERERIAREERAKYEQRLLEALEPWNMTAYEYFTIDKAYGVTVSDVAEFGWLFRLWV